MIYRHHNQDLLGDLELRVDEPLFDWDKARQKKMMHIVWNRGNSDLQFELDGTLQSLPANSFLSLTYFHEVSFREGTNELAIFSFNREFYCINDHDAEVSCNGIIFFGAQTTPVVALSEVMQRKLTLLLAVFEDEFSMKDHVQTEMLRILLKRLIILCTRLARNAEGLESKSLADSELIRRFRFLVDMKFREVKSVQEYADMMYKSPKTLSNAFSKLNETSPIKIIHGRIVLEAKRLLLYSDKNVNEIALELGYVDTPHFFKLFRKMTGESPLSFRENAIKGKIDSESGKIVA